MTSENTTKKKKSIYSITLIGLMAALTCIVAPFSIPIGPVPLSLTSLVIYLTVILLGCKKGTLSYIIYLLIGLAGIPVFSSFTGGFQKLSGPTGGYLIGFIFTALITGFFVDHFMGKRSMYFVGMLLGTLVLYGFGTAWLAYQTDMSFQAALFAGVIPFIPGDLAKMLIALFIGPQIRKQIVKAGFLQ